MTKQLEIKGAMSFPARIFIAGDRTDAERICRAFCFEEGLCVTVQEAQYIYTGGQEAGVVVGLINYPRFPKVPEQITEIAERLGMNLMEGLFQTSFTVETPAATLWYSRRST